MFLQEHELELSTKPCRLRMFLKEHYAFALVFLQEHSTGFAHKIVVVHS